MNMLSINKFLGLLAFSFWFFSPGLSYAQFTSHVTGNVVGEYVNGTQYVENGGSTGTAGVAGSGSTVIGIQDVLQGGTAYYSVIGGNIGSDYGSQYVRDGAVTYDTHLNAHGDQAVYSGGITHDTTIYGGIQNVYAGAIANGTVLDTGAQYVKGVANGTVSNGGGVTLETGGKLDGATINGGNLIIRGGTADGTIINGGWVEVRGIADQSDFSNYTFNSGSLNIYGVNWDGFVLDNANQKLSFSSDYYSGGNTLNNLIINNGTVQGFGNYYVTNMEMHGGNIEYMDSKTTIDGLLMTGGYLRSGFATFMNVELTGGQLYLSDYGANISDSLINGGILRMSGYQNIFTDNIIIDGGSVVEIPISAKSYNTTVKNG